MKYIKQFAIIMGITCLGEVINYMVPLPIPASIYGMIILFVLLVSGILKLEQVEETGDFLVSIMPIMFIPAAVGIIDVFVEVQTMLWPILLALFPITVLVMVMSGKATEFLVERKKDIDE